MIKLVDLLPEGKRPTLNAINKVADKYGLELVKGDGYFYWVDNGKVKSVTDKIWKSGIETTVPVYQITNQTWEQWVEDLKYMLKQLGVKYNG